MRKIIFAFVAFASLLVSGCGYSSKDNEVVGQAKRVVKQTPIICPDYAEFDMSLGVMQGGTGSVSTHDLWLTVGQGVDIKKLQAAVETGAIVKATYSKARVTFCVEPYIMTSFEVLKQ